MCCGDFHFVLQNQEIIEFPFVLFDLSKEEVVEEHQVRMTDMFLSL